MEQHEVEQKLDRAEALYGERNVEAAAELLVDILNAHPNHSRALADLGVVCYAVEHYEDAVMLFARSVSADNTNFEALNSLMQMFVAGGLPDQALLLWDEFGAFLSRPQQQQLRRLLPRKGKERIKPTRVQVGKVHFSLFLDPHEFSHRHMLDHFQRGLTYEEETTCLFLQQLARGDTVIDVGGHVGYFTLLAAHLVGKPGRVLTFEPSTKNYRKILLHLRKNRLVNAQVFNHALGSTRGTGRFFINLDNYGGHALWDIATHEFNQRSSWCPLVKQIGIQRLDDLISIEEARNVKLIKIDTEGSELAVLQGARATLGEGRVPFVVCEINRFALEHMGGSEQALRAEMAALGYSTYAFVGQGAEVRQLSPSETVLSEHVFNLLFSRERF